MGPTVEMFVEFEGIGAVTHSLGPFEGVHVGTDEITVFGTELLPDLSNGNFFQRVLAKRRDLPRGRADWIIQSGFRLEGTWHKMRVWSHVKPQAPKYHIVGQFPNLTPDQGNDTGGYGVTDVGQE